MSQKKVDAYKAEKKNRKATLAKQKKRKVLYTILGVFIAAVIVGGLGYGIYYSVAGPGKSNTSEGDLQTPEGSMTEEEAMDYINSLIDQGDAEENEE